MMQLKLLDGIVALSSYDPPLERKEYEGVFFLPLKAKVHSNEVCVSVKVLTCTYSFTYAVLTATPNPVRLTTGSSL